jgi:hypothetical protein
MCDSPVLSASTAVQTVIRGEYVFTVRVPRTSDERVDAEHVTMSKDGRCIESGRLEAFFPAYMCLSPLQAGHLPVRAEAGRASRRPPCLHRCVRAPWRTLPAAPSSAAMPARS